MTGVLLLVYIGECYFIGYVIGKGWAASCG